MARNQFAVDHDACGVGFVTRLGHRGSHEIVERALEVLRRLAHRGGVDADGRSGDGAGLLTQIPDSFIRKQARRNGIDLPSVFGLGMVFLPAGNENAARAIIQSTALESGLRCLGRRSVSCDPDVRSEEHTSELQSPCNLVCRLLLEKNNAGMSPYGMAAELNRRKVSAVNGVPWEADSVTSATNLMKILEPNWRNCPPFKPYLGISHH